METNKTKIFCAYRDKLDVNPLTATSNKIDRIVAGLDTYLTSVESYYEANPDKLSRW